MLTTVANVLAGLIGAGITVIGLHAFRAPHAAAGMPAGDALIVLRSNGPESTSNQR